MNDTKLARVIQQPFRFRPAPEPLRGDPIAVNTRNVAVRRSVFDTLLFEDRFHRGCDTAFGRAATLVGFPTFHTPGTVIAHEHEDDLPLRVAKHVCWGWIRRQQADDHPELAVPPGPCNARCHPPPVAHGPAAAPIRSGAALAGRVPDLAVRATFSPILPEWTLGLLLRRASGLAWCSDVYRYQAGEATQPIPSALLHRHLRRD